MSNQLAGRVAVVTGSTRGFGLAVARACAEAGAAVVLTSRTQKTVDNSVDMLKTSALQAVGRTADVQNLPEVEALLDLALETYGRMDIWINNAGIAGPYGPTIHLEPGTFKAVTATNVLGVYHGSLVAMRHFLQQRQGKLLNVLGRGAKSPTPYQNAYAASKAWVKNFTVALAQEYKESGVEVLAYNPGMMRTELLTEVAVVEGYEERLDVLETIVRMWAKPPEEPAQRVVALVSEEGRTGRVINEANLLSLAGGALREGLRRLFGRTADALEVEVHTVPAAYDAQVRQ
ncbi:MAG: SDR family NAD(P)-dependent oxidoreductase [Anaerolineales bacterium]